MSTSGTTSSAFIGAAWFAALLGACMVAETGTGVRLAATSPNATDEHPVLRRTDDEFLEHEPARELSELLTSRTRFSDPLSADEPSVPLVPAPQPTLSARPVTPPPPPEIPAAARSRASGARFIDSAAEPESVPRLPPPEGPNLPAELQISVDRPQTVVAREPVLFTIRVTNPGTQSADGVMLHARFDDGWEYPGSDVPHIEQRLGSVPADAMREVRLSLIPLRSGPGAIEFRVESGSHPPVDETVAVDVQTRAIELGLAGPPRRAVGQHAEYIVTVRNTSGHDLPDARASVEYDPAALIVREASVGFHHQPGTIAWPLGTLLRDERVQIQLEFDCRTEWLQTPVRCSFLTDGQTAAVRQRPLEIVPATVIDVAVSDDDPCAVGDAIGFTVHVRNRGDSPLSGLELRIATSPHFADLAWSDDSRLQSMNTSQDPYGIDVRELQIPPGGDLRLTFSATATLPGDGAVRVLVRAPTLPAPFEVEESLLVNSPLDDE